MQTFRSLLQDFSWWVLKSKMNEPRSTDLLTDLPTDGFSFPDFSSVDEWLERAVHFAKYHLTFYELACLKRILEVEPFHFDARRRELHAFYWIRHEGRLETVFEEFFKDLHSQKGILDDSLFYFYHQECLSLYLFYLYSQPQLTDAEVLAGYKRYLKIPAHSWGAPLKNKVYPPSVPAQKLRIAYFGREFDGNSCMQLLRPMLINHTQNVEIYVYDDSPDQAINALEPFVKKWRYTLNIPNQELLKIMRDDAIDVLVDVAGPTFLMRNEIFWERAAPVQVGGLGFLFSSGKRLDYCLSDRYLTPPELALEYPEKIKYLPTVFMWETPPEHACVMPEHEGLVLGSANSLNKINLQVIEVWSKILKRLPEATLHLKNSRFNDPLTQQMYAQLFAHFGISGHRLRLEPGRGTKECHLTNFYNHIDIALDPFPYQGGITTCDALWMGVPVVSLRTESWLGRALGATILDRSGHQDLVAQNTDEYVEKVVALAANSSQRSLYKHQLRERLRESILCQPQAFSLSLEQAYFEMYQEKKAG